MRRPRVFTPEAVNVESHRPTRLEHAGHQSWIAVDAGSSADTLAVDLARHPLLHQSALKFLGIPVVSRAPILVTEHSLERSPIIFPNRASVSHRKPTSPRTL